MPLSSQDRKAMVWVAIALLCIAFFMTGVMARSQTLTTKDDSQKSEPINGHCQLANIQEDKDCLAKLDAKHAKDQLDREWKMQPTPIPKIEMSVSDMGDFTLKLTGKCTPGRMHVINIVTDLETAAVGVTCNFKGEWGRPWTARIK